MQKHGDREQFFEHEDKPKREVRVIRPEDLWWNCPKCDKRIQPMYDKCVYCQTARPERTKPVEVEPVRPKPPPVPEPEPKPEPVKPAEPEPAKRPAWHIPAYVTGLLGAAILAAKIFAPGYVVMGLELIRQILSAIGG